MKMKLWINKANMQKALDKYALVCYTVPSQTKKGNILWLVENLVN